MNVIIKHLMENGCTFPGAVVSMSVVIVAWYTRPITGALENGYKNRILSTLKELLEHVKSSFVPGN
jgi:hypothetical protein